MSANYPFTTLLLLSLAILLGYKPAPAQELAALNFDVNSPLKSNTVYDLHLASDQLLYITAENGVWSYDGNTFQEYLLPNKSSVEGACLTEDRLGNIYMLGFNDQLYTIKNQQLQAIPYPDFVDGILHGFFVTDKYSYYITERRLLVENHATGVIKNILPSNISSNPQVFSSFLIKGLERNLNFHNYLFFQITGDSILYIDNMPEQSACIGTSNQLYYYQLANPYQIFNKKHEPISSADWIKPQLKDYPTKQFIPLQAYELNGELMIRTNLGLLLPQRQKLYFKGQYVSDVLMDHEQNIWVSTTNAGLYKISSTQYEYYPTNRVQEGSDMVFVHQNKLIYGDEASNLYVWDTLQQQFRCFHKSKISATLKNIYFDPYRQQYVSSGNELNWFNKQLALTYTDLRYGSFSLLDSSRLLSSTPRGNHFYWGFVEGFERRNEQGGNVATKYVEDAIRRKKWVDEVSGSLVFQRPIQIIHFKKWQHWVAALSTDSLYLLDQQEFEIRHRLPVDKPEAIFAGQDRLFIVTDTALLELKAADQLDLYLYRNQGLKQKIEHLSVENQYVAITTRSAVYVVDNQIKKEVYKFTVENGIAGKDFTKAWLYQGDLYINGTVGVTKIPIPVAGYRRGQPAIYLEGIYLNDSLIQSHQLTYQQNNIAIRFKVRSYTTKGVLKWRLNDRNWNQAYANNQVQLNELKPNSYRLELVYTNDLGQSTPPLLMEFEVQPPYWQTWWFYVLINLGIITLLATWFIRKTQQKRQAEQQALQFNSLKLQALQTQMNPHFIFNVLTAVQNLWLQGKEEAALKLQSNFAKLLRYIFEYSSQSAISIDQLVEFLNHYLNLERIRFEHGVHIDFKIDPALEEDDYYITPLLIQPILENSFKHGLLHQEKVRHLILELQQEGQHLYVRIQDNGKGRDHQQLPKRKSGLSTTMERLQLLQSSILGHPHEHKNIKITDLKDAQQNPTGTLVELWIPFVEAPSLSSENHQKNNKLSN